MDAVACSMYFFILYLLHLRLIAGADNASYVPSENIVLNCGSNTSEFVEYDGRNWSGDADSPYVPANADTNSLIARAPDTLDSIPEVPYMTARIFMSQFTYTFNVTPGPNFIRLHFYPASYFHFNVSNAFLSVSAANFTLLHNFSVSLYADYLNLAYFMKEFVVHVSGSVLELTFAPSYNASDAYAFVNGIEIVSMPLDLYIRSDDAPLPLVGHDTKLVYIYNDSAMEMLYRLNVGGEQIPPKYDTGMFRSWDTDEVYILGANIGIQPSNMSMPVLYTDDAPPYSAPADVYRTSRSMAPFENGLVNLNFNMTWYFPVDSADEEFDPIAWSGEPGVAAHRDYVVKVPQANEGKQDLWLDLHPNKDDKPMYYNAFLNGVEIFKLSNFDKNLAGLNPSRRFDSGSDYSDAKAPYVAHFNRSSKKLKYILIGCGLGAVVLPILLCLVLYRLK
ncbi:Receptor-like protein kinase FERONIA, partial [Mucuna pruriens]